MELERLRNEIKNKKKTFDDKGHFVRELTDEEFRCTGQALTLTSESCSHLRIVNLMHALQHTLLWNNRPYSFDSSITIGQTFWSDR